MTNGNRGEITEVRLRLLPGENDRLLCLAMELDLSEAEVISNALSLYYKCAELRAGYPTGVLGFVLDDSYIRINVEEIFGKAQF